MLMAFSTTALRLCLVSAAISLLAPWASADFVRFDIAKREPFAEGKSFGNSGAYERIEGRVFYAIDPAAEPNQTIVDLDKAPRNAAGKVEFFADLFILAPAGPRKGNGAILYDVNNRGNKVALRMFHDGGGGNELKSAADVGDGFLLRHGFTVVWSGWDGELLPGGARLRLSAPVARDGGKTITGLVRCEIVPTSDTKRSVVNWENHGSYRPTAAGSKAVTLTHRVRAADERVPISREEWQIHVTEIENPWPGQLPKVELELPAGMKKGHIYELIYEAQDPLVHGVCFAAVRDLISAFKYGGGKDNPLCLDDKRPITRAHGFGVSQSGRFLREFLHAGFNADEQGRRVFDGLMPHVAGAGLGSFNHRFAQPTRHVQQHDHHDYPADRFPFAYEEQTDPLSGQTDGLLRRAAASGTMPLVMHTQSTGEYWTRSGSLVHTDPLGRRDARVPEQVRIYTFGGTQHGPGAWPPQRGDGQNPENPGDYRPYLRALLLALDRWVSSGTTPPPSVYPTIQAGTLVPWDQKSTGFPAIPGVRYPEVIQQPALFDFGPRWASHGIIDRQPPKSLGDYRVLVPRCGQDGNELGCLSPPEVAVPLATQTGWNLRSKAAGAENELLSLKGSYIPLPATKAQRLQGGDPRLSLEERYGTPEKYLEQLRAKGRELQQAGYLLEEDAERIVKRQQARVSAVWGK
jgi:hypothetical protein